MKIKRDRYLNKMIEHMHTDMVKIITGLRRVGKSYFLSNIFVEYLNSINVKDDHIIYLQLDVLENKKYRDEEYLYNMLKLMIKDEDYYYILLDEVQYVENFWEVLNSLRQIKNVDLYCTGSNSKFLSKDILTEFRGRSVEIHLMPISFKEYIDSFDMENKEAYDKYSLYGGLPYVINLKEDATKKEYLKNLYDEIYLKDIKERKKIKNDDDMQDILNVLSSSVGSFTNPQRLANTFKSLKKESENEINKVLIKNYIDALEDSFIIKSTNRYDIKGRKYINTPKKYYFEDIGLRNARINFRQEEDGHIMENIIYNELIYRGYNVDVGIVEVNDKNKNGGYVRKQLETDFIAMMGHKKYYIQSAYEMGTEEKREQEYRALKNIDDSFKKFVIRYDNNQTYINDYGIINLGLFDFLTNEDCFSFD